MNVLSQAFQKVYKVPPDATSVKMYRFLKGDWDASTNLHF